MFVRKESSICLRPLEEKTNSNMIPTLNINKSYILSKWKEWVPSEEIPHPMKYSEKDEVPSKYPSTNGVPTGSESWWPINKNHVPISHRSSLESCSSLDSPVANQKERVLSKERMSSKCPKKKWPQMSRKRCPKQSSQDEPQNRQFLGTTQVYFKGVFGVVCLGVSNFHQAPRSKRSTSRGFAPKEADRRGFWKTFLLNRQFHESGREGPPSLGDTHGLGIPFKGISQHIKVAPTMGKEQIWVPSN